MRTFSVAPPARQWDGLESCIAHIAQGDRDALALLYRQTYAAVYGFALSILKHPQDAEDVMQETFIQIWKAAGSYTGAGKPMAWIFTVARNLALMRLRQQARCAAADVEQFPAAQDPALSPEDRLTLWALLDSLDDEERQIVVLHAMSGLKHREIAEMMHFPLGTVLSKYNRALKKLRHAMQGGD